MCVLILPIVIIIFRCRFIYALCPNFINNAMFLSNSGSYDIDDDDENNGDGDDDDNDKTQEEHCKVEASVKKSHVGWNTPGDIPTYLKFFL